MMTTIQTPPSDVMPADMLDLSAPERWRRALRALHRTLTNPEDTGQVLLFVGYANAGSIDRRRARFEGDAAWARLLRERRAIDSKTLDLEALLALPADTLGHAYAHFLRSHGLTPDVFDGPPPGVRDPMIAYAIQRLRQTHDLWHVVTNHETDFVGEIALQAFTYAQLEAPASLILAVAGTLRAHREVPTLAHDAITAFRAGRRANRLASFPWEDHWTTPLADVRRMLNVTPVAPRARIELPTTLVA
ncbi:MAG: Coq4 family protein [Proteobacteria bacterium]|nr:Coq4 family protein [Pseudomonadota bacterium]